MYLSVASNCLYNAWSDYWMPRAESLCALWLKVLWFGTRWISLGQSESADVLLPKQWFWVQMDRKSWFLMLCSDDLFPPPNLNYIQFNGSNKKITIWFFFPFSFLTLVSFKRRSIWFNKNIGRSENWVYSLFKCKMQEMRILKPRQELNNFIFDNFPFCQLSFKATATVTAAGRQHQTFFFF